MYIISQIHVYFICYIGKITLTIRNTYCIFIMGTGGPSNFTPVLAYEELDEANCIRCLIPIVGPSHGPSLLLSRRCRLCDKWRQNPVPSIVFHPNNIICFCGYCGIHMPIPMQQAIFYFTFVHVVGCSAKLSPPMVCNCHPYLPIEVLCLPNMS